MHRYAQRLDRPLAYLPTVALREGGLHLCLLARRSFFYLAEALCAG